VEMELEFLERSPERVRFVLSGVSAGFANSLRRAMIAEVPKLAIDEVEIHENSSLLYDEQLALRLALIPLKVSPSDLRNFVPAEECECGGEGCEKCEAKLRLEAVSPETEGSITVYSRDLESLDSRVRVAYENIPIVKLFSKAREVGTFRDIARQRISLVAKARLGTGKKHAKWQPVTACGFKNMPKIEISDACNGCGRCVDACPRNILSVERGVAVVSAAVNECSLCKLCEDACEEQKAIRVSASEDTFVFFVESDGSLPVDEIVASAARIMQKKCEDFIAEIERIEEEGVDVEESEGG